MTAPVRGLAVTYHYVRDTARSPFPAIKALSVADFEQQVDHLASRFDIVDYARWTAILDGAIVADRPFALLTFDDGFVDHSDIVAPILESRGVRGLFFVCGRGLERRSLLNVHRAHFLLARLGAGDVHRRLTAAAAGLVPASAREGIYRYDEPADLAIKRLITYELPRDVADAILCEMFQKVIGDEAAFAEALYLSPETMRRMAAHGHAFGWHTESHPVLSRLTPAQQADELARGRDALDGCTCGVAPSFCYPYGHRHTYDETGLRLLAQFGYRMAFTVIRGALGPGPDFGARFELPRVDCRDVPPCSPAIAVLEE